MQIRVSEAALRRTVTEIFVACGVPADDAADGADVLVSADLRGVETHGVSNMLRDYVAWFQNGELNPESDDRRSSARRPAAPTFDGDRGLGILQGRKAMQLAIDKARNVGVGVVTMRNSGHLGAVGHFAMQAANQGHGRRLHDRDEQARPPDLRRRTAPRHEPDLDRGAGRERSPSCSTTRRPRRSPATRSAWPAGSARTSSRAGSPKPDGTPIMDAHPVPSGERYALGGFNLLPLGGTREQGSHKGFGLGLMVEMLTTMLSGSVPSMLEGPAPVRAPPLRRLRHRRLLRPRRVQRDDGRDAPDAGRHPARARATRGSSTPACPNTRPNSTAAPTASRCTARSSTGSTAAPTSLGLDCIETVSIDETTRT